MKINKYDPEGQPMSDRKIEAGFKAIFLEAFPSNTHAFDFYIRNGFVRNEGRFLKYVL